MMLASLSRTAGTAILAGLILMAVCTADSVSRAAEGRAVPLHNAAEVGNLGLVQRLLAEDADADARDALGRTPLMTAAARGHYEVVLTLVRAGASVNLRANNGKTALQLAVENGRSKIAKLLEAYGAKK